MNGTVLVLTVAAVGVLHTLVPDHWAPIAVVARAQGWSRAHTARSAAIAGLGHVTSTLVLGLLVWAIGAAFAVRYGTMVDRAAALALIAFGVWIAWSGWRELREGHASSEGGGAISHAHLHRHDDGTEHVHWHRHQEPHLAATTGGAAVLHEHDHAIAGRTALLLILGSSPMIEGLPAFFAASTYGAPLLLLMAIVFALATIATYVGVSVAAVAGIERVAFGPLERYGEVFSGGVVAAVGIAAVVAGR
jgi:hypothetical protein